MTVRRSLLAASAATMAALAIASSAPPASARVIQTIGNSGADPLRIPWQVALGPGGSVHALDHGDRGAAPVFMRVYTPAGALVRRWPVRALVAGDDAQAMVVDPAGDVFVAGAVADAVLKYSPTGQLLLRLGPFSGAPGQFPGPIGVGVDPAGNVVVQNARYARIETFTPDGRPLRTWPYPDDPRSTTVSVGASGSVYVADAQGIAKLDSTGTPVARIPRPRQLGPLFRLIEGPAGTLYALRSDRIGKLGADGTYGGAVGTGGSSAAVAGDGSIYVPSGIPSSRGAAGAVLRLAPIAVVDETPPSLSIDRFSLARRGRSLRVPGRLRYTLTEDASLRVSLLRRAKTTNRRHRDFGRFLFMGSRRLPVVAADSRTLVLDWRTLGSGAYLPPGVFRVTVVARDDSGNESKPARVTFRVRR